jgi:hypothetical protein
MVLPARAGETRTVLLPELNAYVPLPWEIWLVNRGRLDLRDVDGEFSVRFRYRLGLEREITVRDRTVIPYAQAEVFYDTHYGARSRERYQVGVEIELSERWRNGRCRRGVSSWGPGSSRSGAGARRCWQ